MDTYLKILAGTLMALVLCLVLSKQGTHFEMLLSLVTCCLILVGAASFLEPVISFFHSLEELIPLDSALLETVLKVVGIAMVGEIGTMICTDGGNAALGKALQMLTSALILWLSLPVLGALVDLIREILEAL